MQYGRRGTSGQTIVKHPSDPEHFARQQAWAKEDKGYIRVVGPLTFDWANSLPNTPTLSHVIASGLSASFDSVWREQYTSMFAALAQDTQDHSLILLTYPSDDYRAWPWLTELGGLLRIGTHHDTPDGLLAVVPSRAARLMDNANIKVQNLVQLLHSDDEHTLEVFAGVWTPHAKELDTASPDVAIEASRLLATI
jgi:hypothetical protein